jgi:hypothetical protein
MNQPPGAHAPGGSFFVPEWTDACPAQDGTQSPGVVGPGSVDARMT